MYRLASVVIVVFAVGACATPRKTSWSVSLRVPPDAPCGLSTCVGLPHDFGGAAPDDLRFLRATGLEARPVPAQFVADLDASGAPTAHGTLWIPLTVRPEQRGRTVRVTLERAEGGEPPVQLREIAGEATVFVEKGQAVARYNHGPGGGYERAPGVRVTNYVHPLLGLDGELITDCAPADHPHHRGLFWSWVRHRRNGQPRGDWWTLRDLFYRLERVARREAGALLATVTAEGCWEYSGTPGTPPDRLVREVATLRVFAATESCRILEADLDLYGVGAGVEIAGQSDRDKGYGGFTLRFKRPASVRITADGKALRNDGLMYRAAWADYSGPFGGGDGWSGAAIFSSPSHPQHPPGWCLRHYGVLNPSYPGLDFVALSPDRPLRLRYRIVVHRGDADAARLSERFALYAADWSAPHDDSQ